VDTFLRASCGSARGLHRLIVLTALVLSACVPTDQHRQPTTGIEASASPETTSRPTPKSTVSTSEWKTYADPAGVFTIRYPPNWILGRPESGFAITNGTPGIAKSSVRIVHRSGPESRPEGEVRSLVAETGLGAVELKRFTAPGYLGQAPYFSEVLSGTVTVTGQDWLIEARVQEMGRDEFIRILQAMLLTWRFR